MLLYSLYSILFLTFTVAFIIVFFCFTLQRYAKHGKRQNLFPLQYFMDISVIRPLWINSAMHWATILATN